MALLNLKTDNYGVCPEFEFLVTDEERAVIDEDSNVVTGKRIGYVSPKRYRLSWRNGTEAEAWKVRTLFQEAGLTEPMNYIAPDETSITEVRFVENLVIERHSAVRWEMEFEVEEVV
jgi:hypothetical protein